MFIQTVSGEWAHPITGQIIFEGTLPLQRFGEELTGRVGRWRGGEGSDGADDLHLIA